MTIELIWPFNLLDTLDLCHQYLYEIQTVFSVESGEATMKSGVIMDTDIRQKTRVVVSSEVMCRSRIGLRRLSQVDYLAEAIATCFYGVGMKFEGTWKGGNEWGKFVRIEQK
ncbi:hypothetical protein VNO80_03614 [Phaseolus coccineus]|uniref:Uncharacterized protein n=1 Tax=Phaseolus coccineus TaxID=3886 RepID=A0AAN9NSL8_PHACN